MNKRKMKKLFAGIDDMSMPAIEKMLPSQALVKKEAPLTERRKAFPRLAVVSLAMVAILVATALVIGSMASSSPQSTNQGSPFDNSIVAGISNSEDSRENASADKDTEISHADNSTAVNVGNGDESCENTSTDTDKDKDEDEDTSHSDNSSSVEAGSGEETRDNESTDKDDAPTDKGNESTDKGNEEPKTTLPIVTCGKYAGFTDGAVLYVPYGEVFIQTMQGIPIDIEELQGDVLYAVYFKADPVGYADYDAQTEYRNELNRLSEEKKAKCEEAKKNAIAFIAKYAKAENHFYVREFEDRDYQEICEMIYGLSYENWPGKEAPEYEDIVYADSTIWYECEEKILEFERSARENATAKMYAHLESLGVEFYDKEVYTSFSPISTDIYYHGVYRIAFLTKEQIKLLEGGEDYGILIEIVFDELAKMDTEPVYLQPWCVDA